VGLGGKELEREAGGAPCAQPIDDSHPREASKKNRPGVACRRGGRRRHPDRPRERRRHHRAAGGDSPAAASTMFLFDIETRSVKAMRESIQLEVGLLQNFNMLIADTEHRVCAVVDPAYEVDRLLREAGARGWSIRTVLVTHTHHDHVDGLEEMVR